MVPDREQLRGLRQAFFEGQDPVIFLAAGASETLSLPKSLQAKAKRVLQDIWMAGTWKAAEAALDAFH
jgi:hypothetical protein